MRMLAGVAAFLFVLARGGCSGQDTGAEPTSIMLTADGVDEQEKQKAGKR